MICYAGAYDAPRADADYATLMMMSRYRCHAAVADLPVFITPYALRLMPLAA